jgi:protein TonB
VIPFGAGMVRPTIVTPAELTCSREARAMHSNGVALLKCTINVDGSLSDCALQKGVPNMDQQILQGVRTMRFTPVMFQGRPARVSYIVTLRVTGC